MDSRLRGNDEPARTTSPAKDHFPKNRRGRLVVGPLLIFGPPWLAHVLLMAVLTHGDLPRGEMGGIISNGAMARAVPRARAALFVSISVAYASIGALRSARNRRLIAIIRNARTGVRSLRQQAIDDAAICSAQAAERWPSSTVTAKT